LRPEQILRSSRSARLGAGALLLAIPASAVALTAGRADAQSVITINPVARHIAFGRAVTVTGNAGVTDAGSSVELQYAPPGATNWRALASSRVLSDGSFRLVAALRRSGVVRVVAIPSTGSSPDVASAPSTTVTTPTPSAHAPVSVRARFVVPSPSIDVLSGNAAEIRGTLLPAVAGRRVRLLGRSGGSWHTLASSRTGGKGGFALHYEPTATGESWLKVRFRGDRLNTADSRRAGSVTAFREAVASWYGDAGGTACGFHAYFGVAHKTLPCGTKVTFRYGGRSVTAVVDDRGPFVGGREWDLNQNTAAALGFGGVGIVWSSI